MNIQQAYNKGLDDAENAVYKSLTDALASVDSGELANPKMESLRQLVLATSKNDTQGNVSCGATSCQRDTIAKIIKGEEVQISDDNVISVFKDLMEYFRQIASKKTNVGKAFAKILKDKENQLTSE